MISANGERREELAALAGWAEDSPPPVADEGEPQAGENTERAERSKRRQATMFSTGKDGGWGMNR